MTMTHQESLVLLAKLRTKTPIRDNIPLRQGRRYPKDFKALVLEALRQGISISEISDSTKLKGFTIRQWKEAEFPKKKSVRKLQVVSEEKINTPPSNKALTIKIGSSVSFEIQPQDLTRELLTILAEI